MRLNDITPIESIRDEFKKSGFVLKVDDFDYHLTIAKYLLSEATGHGNALVVQKILINLRLLDEDLNPTPKGKFYMYHYFCGSEFIMGTINTDVELTRKLLNKKGFKCVCPDRLYREYKSSRVDVEFHPLGHIVRITGRGVDATLTFNIKLNALKKVFYLITGEELI